MGWQDNQAQEKKDKRKGGKRKAAPWAEGESRQDAVRWREVEEMLVAYVVDAACQSDASVQFTRSRDGGALGVRVYDEAFIPRTQWGRPGGEIEDILRQIGDHYSKDVSPGDAE